MSQRDWELSFWKGEIAKGGDAFLEQRKRDWEDHLKHFPELANKGKILEVGTGLVSVFEFSDKDCISIDPLQDEYLALFKKPDSKVDYRSNWDGIRVASFDEILCVNVIDHTPNPDDLLQQMRAAIKPGGKLYLEVNFDSTLSPAHYGIWDKTKIDSSMRGWKLISEELEPNRAYNQVKYWATYICERPRSSSQATSSTKK